MDYPTAEKYLYELTMFGTKLGLDNIRALLSRIGNPHHNLTFIHIAGTNGKGSVCAILNALLTAAGHRTGMFTSPHLVSLRERFKINNRIISCRDFVASFKKVYDAVTQMNTAGIYPTFFEVVTAMALHYFARKEVQFVIWETGLGGTYDATNAVDARYAVITTVERDHCEYLGDTLEQIARDKAGIIKPSAQFFTGERRPSLRSLFEQICSERGAAYSHTDNSNLKILRKSPSSVCFDYICNNERFESLTVPFGSNFLLNNLLLALRVFDAVCADTGLAHDRTGYEQVLRSGLPTIRLNGRFQRITADPVVMVDVAHNPAGMYALLDAVHSAYPGYAIHVLFGVMADKEYDEICKIIVPHAQRITCVTPPAKRALHNDILADTCRSYAHDAQIVRCSNNWIDDIRAFTDEYRSSQTLLLVCGSFYLIGDVLKRLGKSRIICHDKECDYR